MSLMQMMLGSVSIAQSLTFIASATSTSTGTAASTIVIPATAAIGDIAVLFEMNFSGGVGSASYSGTPAAPAGWTQINSANAGAITSGVGVVNSYKVLVSGDPGATVTCLSGIGTGGCRNIILIFRPARTPIITTANVNGQSTTAVPTNQSIGGGAVAPSIYLAHWAASAAITTRGSTVTMTEVAGASTQQYAKYLIYNSGTSPGTSTISTTDVGTNGMQSLVLNVA